MLDSMKYDVGLSMSARQLGTLRDHYKYKLRRDPHLDELYLLDRILELRQSTSTPITTLTTDSDTLSQTYADVMAKRKTLPSTDAPPTVEEISGIASAYLERIGKSAYPHKAMLFSYGALAPHQLSIGGCHNVISTPHASVGTLPQRRAVSAGDWLVILNPSPEASCDRYQVFNEYVKISVTIGKGGMIEAVRHFSGGAYIDTATLPIPQPCELTALCDACHGAVLAVIPHEKISAFISGTKQAGMVSFVIGSLASNGKLTINHARIGTVSFIMQFIRELAPQCNCAAHVRERYDISKGTQRTESYIKVASDGSRVLATNKAILPDSPFRASLFAATQAIAGCVAQGADYNQVCLSAGIQAPNGDYTNQNLESLLGIYRAQMEFCIPDIDSTTAGLSAGRGFSVTVCATAPLPPKTAPKISSQGALYLLRPRIEKNGLPCFEELRRMWRYVNQLHKDGKIIAACAALDTVDDTLKQLIGEDSEFIPENSFKNAGSLRESAAILLISTDHIHGELLGKVSAPLFDEVVEQF